MFFIVTAGSSLCPQLFKILLPTNLLWFSLAESLGVDYPGENFEPCHLCYDRSARLQDLEFRMRKQVGNQTLYLENGSGTWNLDWHSFDCVTKSLFSWAFFRQFVGALKTYLIFWMKFDESLSRLQVFQRGMEEGGDEGREGKVGRQGIYHNSSRAEWG